jgi:hypothetical protein
MYSIDPNIETDDERRRKMAAALPVVGGEVPVTVDATGQPEIDPRPTLPEISAVPASVPLDAPPVVHSIDPPVLPPITNPYATKDTQAQVAGRLIPDNPHPNLPVIDPNEARLGELQSEYNQIGQRDPNHEHSKWSRVAAAIEGWATGGILGGIKAAENPHYFEQQKDDEERARLLPQIGAMQKIRDANLDANYRRAQTATIPIDDANNAQRIKDLADARANTIQTQAAAKLASLKTFDPKNPAHIALAKRAGKTDDEIAAMKGWDYTNPVEHKIDGEVYKLNRITGEYEPSNLPVNEREKLVSFDAVDADGKVIGSYKVLPEKAASLAQSLRLKNLELKARADLQTQRIGAASTARAEARDFKKEMADYAAQNGQTKAVQRATESFTKTYMKLHKGKAPSQDEITGYLGTIFPQQ